MILYFSATGNTEYIALELGKRLIMKKLSHKFMPHSPYINFSIRKDTSLPKCLF